MMDLLYKCKLCPRNCSVNRLDGQVGFCGAGSGIKVARVSLHNWEEPCLSGENGSGTIFFSQCNLKCVFCQNHSISHKGIGKEITIERLAEIFIEQQERGAHNINLVTPTHFVPQIIEAIKLARSRGLIVPMVYNSNGYESLEAIQALKGYIDVYLPDFKYYDDKYAVRYSQAPNYFKSAENAIEEMFSQVGDAQFNENGMMMKGVIIRHLMLPGLLFDSKKVVDYVWKTFGHSVYISIMNQYTPVNNADKYPEINKPLNQDHYESLIDYCLSLGIKNAFIQEGGTVSESFIPHFDLRGV
jgi:putative pyruvate formate lyase activating enzyme